MACGTAAVVTPVGKVSGKQGEFTIGSGGALTGRGTDTQANVTANVSAYIDDNIAVNGCTHFYS